MIKAEGFSVTNGIKCIKPITYPYEDQEKSSFQKIAPSL
jgi:hypothetical protein